MATNRRDFIKKAVAALAAIPFLSSFGVYAEEADTQRNMKKIMIIDGGPRKNMNTAAS